MKANPPRFRMEHLLKRFAPFEPGAQRPAWQDAPAEGYGEVMYDMLSPEERFRLVQELRIHHAELEMQNEELQRSHQELEAARDNYRSLYDRAPVGYFTISDRSAVLEVNLTGADMVGKERSELLTLPFTSMIHPEDMGLYYARRKMIFGAEGPQSFDIRLLDGQGGFRWVNLQGVLTSDHRGVHAWLATLSDIQVRKEDEAALLQGQKLESMGILAGGVAHDFNNLLTVMLGHLELAQVIDPGGKEAHLAVVRESILRAAALCKQLLAYAGKAEFQREPIRVNDMLESCAAFLHISVAKTTEIQFDLHPDLPLLEGDAAQLEQVVMNLVVNASEAQRGGGGKVVIRTRAGRLEAADMDAFVPGTKLEPGAYVVLEVADNGNGMEPATLKRIFDPFFTTKFTGRGLGLAALLGIMRALGGGVQVRSTPGEGTTFELWFPALEASEEDQVSAAPELLAPEFHGTGTILIVDDEAMLRDVLGMMLDTLGFEILQAANGQEGVDAYRRAAGRIKLVLMDLTMPRMGGLEATRRILEEFPDARIALMSGYVQEPVFELPEGAQLWGFLRKPFTRANLLQVLMASLERDERASL